MKAGRKVCAKLETRIKELEGELDQGHLTIHLPNLK